VGSELRYSFEKGKDESQRGKTIDRRETVRLNAMRPLR